MNSIQKLHEALKDNPELQRKITEEANRLVENKEADEQDALGRVVRENLDIDLTREELDALFAKVRELDPEQLAQAAGGLEIAGIKIDNDTLKASGVVGSTLVFGGIGTAVCPGPGTFVGGVVGFVAGLASLSLFD